MITEAFDNRSPVIINPQMKENAPWVDAWYSDFSQVNTVTGENYVCKMPAES